MCDDPAARAARQAVADLRDLGDQAHAAARRLNDALLATPPVVSPPHPADPPRPVLTRRWAILSLRRSQR